MRDILRRWWWLPPLALVFLLAWGPALFGPFHFDDDLAVVDYAPVHSLAAWWQAQPGLRPLLKFSYALNWQLDPAPFGFHLVNLLLHELNGVLALLWLRRVLPPAQHAVAGFAVALWFVHPATTEAVTYVSGRSVSLAATFTLAALLASTRGAHGLAALCVALAVAVRETCAVLPLALALNAALCGTDRRGMWRAVWPSLAVALLAGAAFLLEPHHRRLLALSLPAGDAGSALWTQMEGWRWMLGQMFLLTPSDIDPDLRVQTAATLPNVLMLAALASGVWLSLRALVRRRAPAAGFFLLAVLLLLPAHGVLVRADIANDRHLYLPLLLSLAALLLWYPARLAPPDPWRKTVFAVALCVLAALTALRNFDYLDAVTLWRSTVMQSPAKSRPWNNLGQACEEAGNPDCAADAYARAAALDPQNLRARANLYFLRRAQ